MPKGDKNVLNHEAHVERIRFVLELLADEKYHTESEIMGAVESTGKTGGVSKYTVKSLQQDVYDLRQVGNVIDFNRKVGYKLVYRSDTEIGARVLKNKKEPCCVVCGKPTALGRYKFCSQACQTEYKRRRERDRCKKPSVIESTRTPRKQIFHSPLSATAAAAREAGLSYGQYVFIHGGAKA